MGGASAQTQLCVSLLPENVLLWTGLFVCLFVSFRLVYKERVC